MKESISDRDRESRAQIALGALIKKLRTDKGMSQDALANAIGKSKQAVSCYERGLYSPTMLALVDIAQACGTTISDFFNDLSVEINVPVSDIVIERKIIEREIELSHDALDRAGVEREAHKIPYSVPERIGIFHRSGEILRREHAASHDDLTLIGIEEGLTLPDRVRQLIRARDAKENHVLRLWADGFDLGYDISIEKKMTSKNIEEATKYNIHAARARAGLLEWSGIKVEIERLN